MRKLQSYIACGFLFLAMTLSKSTVLAAVEAPAIQLKETGEKNVYEVIITDWDQSAYAVETRFAVNSPVQKAEFKFDAASESDFAYDKQESRDGKTVFSIYLSKLSPISEGNVVTLGTLQVTSGETISPDSGSGYLKLVDADYRETEQKNAAVTLVKNSEGGNTPGGDEESDTPGGNGGSDTPGGDGGNDTPGGNGGSDTPGGGGSDTPGGDGGNDTPGGNGGSNTPGGDGENDTPGGNGGSDTPGGDGGNDTPGGNGGSNTPDGNDGGNHQSGTDNGGSDQGQDGSNHSTENSVKPSSDAVVVPVKQTASNKKQDQRNSGSSQQVESSQEASAEIKPDAGDETKLSEHERQEGQENQESQDSMEAAGQQDESLQANAPASEETKKQTKTGGKVWPFVAACVAVVGVAGIGTGVFMYRKKK